MTDTNPNTAATPVLYHLEDGVARLRLNRPESLNSLDLDTIDQLVAGARRAAADGAGALMLTGAGRAFCSGADLGSALRFKDAEGQIDLGAPMRTHFNLLISTLRSLPMPLVVAVNGIAAGGGMSLALSGDVVIAARSASFRQSFIDIGLIPDMGATAIVPGLLGRARTLGLALLGQGLAAEKAAEWGLIWEVVDDEALADRALQLAAALSRRPSALVRAIKTALYPDAAEELEAALANEARVQASLGREPRFAASVEAFLSKRTKASR